MAFDYEVQQGDCIGSIAFANGFNWQTIWNHPGNAALKAKRTDPNVLLPGDTVHIPDLNLRVESCSTDQQHNFQLKNVPAKLRLQLLEEEKDNDKTAQSDAEDSQYEDPDFHSSTKKNKPRAGMPYLLLIDDQIVKQGKSDKMGVIATTLSPGAAQGRLVLNPGTSREETYPLQLGGLDPVTETEGIKKRLNNLGFPCGDGAGDTPELEAALSLFQEKSGLTITGKVDDATRQKLKTTHGG
jgi:hypothetical protein